MSVTGEPLRPAWLTSTNGGPYFADDLDWIPFPHTELIDGNLIFQCQEWLFCFLAKDAIRSALKHAVPSRLFMVKETAANQVVDRAAVGGTDQPNIEGADAFLVVDVVPPESRSGDRQAGADLYAAAGIPHFWLVQDSGGKIVTEVWKLNQELGSYQLVDRFTDCLEVEEPFPVRLDLWDFAEIRS